MELAKMMGKKTYMRRKTRLSSDGCVGGSFWMDKNAAEF